MAWFKVDDGFGQHPKVLRIPRRDRPASIGAWLLAGTWCAQQETDGHIPNYMLDELGITETQAQTLCRVGLWRRVPAVSQRDKHGVPWDTPDEDGGYQFHDWGTYQPLRAELKEKREADRQRKAEYRARKKSKQPATSPNEGESVPLGQTRTDTGQNAASNPPDPTRPDPLLKEIHKGKTETRLPQNWQPTPEHHQRAKHTGLNIDTQVDKFRAHALEKDRRAKNWNGAFTRWLINAAEYAEQDKLRRRTPAPQRPTTDDRVAGWLALAEEAETDGEPDWKELTA